MGRRTSRKLASRTSRPIRANAGKRTRAQVLKVTGPINDKIDRLKEQQRDRMYELMKAERFDDWDREKLEFDRKIEALEDKLGPLDHEYWAAKKNPLASNGGKRVSKRGGGDFRRIEDAAREAGWEIEHTRSGHMVFRSPDKSVPPIYLSADLGAPRQIRNIESMLRRAGLETHPSRMKRNPVPPPPEDDVDFKSWAQKTFAPGTRVRLLWPRISTQAAAAAEPKERIMKYRAKVTIEFDVTIPGNNDEYRADEVEQEINDLTEGAAVTLYDNLHNNARAGHPWVDINLKPLPTTKRSSKQRR